jgi:predicted  nucleic acid-binding Zn-ribbon protein
MVINAAQIAEAQKIAELLEQEALSGAGAQPVYLINNPDLNFQIEETDSASINATPLNSTEVNEAIATGSASPATPTDSEQYLENTEEYNDALNESGGAGGAGGTRRTNRSYGSGTGGAIEAVNDLDSEATDAVLGFTEEEYSHYNTETGYWEPDPEKLEQFELFLLKRANILACILTMLSSISDLRQLAEETFTGTPIEEVKHSAKDIYSKRIKSLTKIARTAIGKVFEKINSENKKLFDDRMDDIKANNEGSGADTENFCTGGNRDIETQEMALKEQMRYLESTSNTLEAMQGVINSLIDFLLATLGSEDFGTLSVVQSLREFNDKIEELSTKVDEQIEEIKDKMAELVDAEVIGWLGFVMALCGGIVGLAINWIITECGSNADWAEGLDYMDDVSIDQMLKDYRGGIVAAQNGQRLAVAMQLSRMDLWNTARQQLTGLSGVQTNAEIVMAATESTMGHVLQVLDMTSSQLMLKTSLHNLATKSAQDLQQLRKAQGIRLASFGLSIIMLALSIVITCLTFGSGAMLILAAIVAVLAIAKSLADTYAATVIADVDSYDPPAPNDDFDHGVQSQGNTTLDGLNAMEAAQAENMSAATATAGLLGTTTDGYYYFNSTAFSVFELKQMMLDNAIRMTFAMMKQMRDLLRVAQAELTGKSVANSSEALLQNAVENILLQKDLVLSAIKFMHQQIVEAKNIVRQKQIMTDKAWNNFGWSLLGNVVGAVLGGALGGAPGALLGMSIGGTLASSIYQYVSGYFDRYWSMDINCGASMREINNLLAEQGNQSIEAKIDQAMAEAFEELMTNGISSIGDGYSAVNSGAVSGMYNRLQRIFAAVELVAKGKSMMSELRAIVKQQLTGITLSRSGELSQSINQARFSTMMRVGQNLVRFLSQRVQVLNRANDAAKQQTLSLSLMIVNAVLSVVAFACVGVTNTIANALAGLAPALMSLASSLGNMIQAIISSTAGFGDYSNYNAKTEVDKTGRVIRNGEGIDARLDQLEHDIMCEMNTGLIETLDGGYSTVSADSALLSTRLKNLANVREAIAIARSSISAMMDEVRAQLTGKRVGEATFGRETLDNHKQISLEILGSLKMALDTIADRYNKIAEADRQILISAIQGAISLASLVISAVSAVKQGEIKQMDRTGADTNVRGGTYPTQATPGAPAAPTPAPAQPVAAQPAPSQAQPVTPAAAQPAPRGEQQAAREASSHLQSRSELAGQVTTLGRVNAVLNLCNLLFTIIAEVAWDHSSSVRSAISPSSQRGQASRPQAGRNLEVKKNEGGDRNAFSSLDNMDADIDNAEYDSTVYQTRMNVRSAIAHRSEVLVQQCFNLIKSIPDTVKAFHNPKTEGAYAAGVTSRVQQFARTYSTEATVQMISQGCTDPVDLEIAIDALGNMHANPTESQRSTEVVRQLRDQIEHDPNLAPEAKTRLLQRCDAAIAHLANPQAAQQARPVEAPRQPEQAPATQRVQALLEQARRIEAGIQAQQAELTRLEPQYTELAAEVAAVRGQLEQPNSETSRASLDARLTELEQELTEINIQREAVRTRIAALDAELQTARQEAVEIQQQVQGQINDINTRAAALQSERERLLQLPSRTTEQNLRIQTIDRELADLQTQRQILGSADASDVLGRVAEVRGQIEEARRSLRELDQQANQTRESIVSIRRVLHDRERTAAAQQPQAAPAAGPSMFAQITSYFRQAERGREADVDRIDPDQQQAGEVVHASGEEPPVLAALRGIDLRRESDHERWERLAGEQEGVQAMTGAGVA